MPTLHDLELISFKLCPFVQRTAIVAQEKSVALKVTYIDLKNKPDWFLNVSPFGKVPVLRVGDKAVFESSVIMEYFDDITEGSLRPQNSLTHAINRSWIEFGSELIMDQFNYLRSETNSQLEQMRCKYESSLARLEVALIHEPFFNGIDFCLIDAAFAPIFKRQDILTSISGENPISQFPKVLNWGKHLSEKSSVQASLPTNFEKIFISTFGDMSGVLFSQELLTEG